MIALQGYEVQENIQEGKDTTVYRGVRQKDRKPVIIKVTRDDYPSQRELDKLRKEYELARLLDFGGVVKPLSLEKYNNGIALITEDFGGTSLHNYSKENEITLEDFLNIAISLTAALGNIHRKELIHMDIKPQNIIYNKSTNEVFIIDFGISTRLSRENPSIVSPGRMAGTLAYISPEQTGRMNRTIDYRTDFYSLGVTFYEMLTGQLPFTATDPMEIVHSHMALQPRAPHEIKPDVPEGISRLIMKLLSKNAEDRYQSAYGLRSDLETAQKALRESGSIKDFEIGLQDKSERFQIPQKLYGREVETRTLMSAFQNVAEGGATLMMVKGYSGIGKSALVSEVHKPIVEHRGYFISGKFDQFKRDIPYSSIIQAFKELVRQVLTEGKEQTEIWKDKLMTALGPNGQVIIDVIPEVELIIGPQSPVVELGPTESQNRFNLVFKDFVSTFAQKEHPLVIFLDDLQWSDSPTLKLIQMMMSDPDTKYLFMICAYRDNEVDEHHPLMGILAELEKAGLAAEFIALTPLDVEHVVQITADTLNSTPDATLELSQLVFNKTNGNPFFVSEFLKTLYNENYLEFDPGSGNWTWDLNKIHGLAITDNVVELMAGKIQKLPEETVHVLRLASCIGNVFDLSSLAIVYEKPRKETASILEKALQEGLVMPIGDAYKFNTEKGRVTYKFLHDRVQQAAYSLIPENEKKSVHLRIGRDMLENLKKENLEEELFDIVNHLNIGAELITSSDEMRRLAELNLQAGRKAKSSTAYEPALNFLRTGMSFLPDGSWKSHYDLAVNLHVELADVEMLNSNFEESAELENEIIKNAKDVFDKSRAYDIKIRSLNAQNRLEECLTAAREILKMLGVNFPKNPGFVTHVGPALMRAKITTLLKGGAHSLFKAPMMKDPRKVEAMRILMNISSTTYQSSFNAFAYLVMTMVYLSYRYGNAAQTPYGIAMYALAHAGVLQDFGGAIKYSQISLDLQENVTRDPAIKGMVTFVNYSFVRFWRFHMREMFAPLVDGAQALFEAGNNEFAGYVGACRNQNMLFSTEALPDIEKEAEKYYKILTVYKQQLPLNLVKVWGQFVHNFVGGAEDRANLIGKFMEEGDLQRMIETRHFTAVAYAYIGRAALRFHFGEHEKALEECTEAFKYEQAILALAPILPMYFYYCLIQLALARDAKTKSAKKKHVKKIRWKLWQLRRWAKAAPHNQHHVDLIEAEKAALAGNNARAMDLYDQAVAGAKEAEYMFNEAVALERAGEFYASIGKEKIALTYLHDAHYVYSRWGGRTKVKYLEEKFPALRTLVHGRESMSDTHGGTTTGDGITSSSVGGFTTAGATAGTTAAGGGSLDLATVMKASQAISGEIKLEKLLDQLMRILVENAGAQKGLLILNRDGKLIVEAERDVDSAEVKVLQSQPVEANSSLAMSIVNYVERARDSIVLNDAANEGQFTNDAYIKRAQPRSVLCSPIINQGKLVGMVYMENNLATGAFTPDRLTVLNMMSSQAAISLENASLYANLEEKVEERTSELRASKREIDDIMANVQQGLMTLNKDGTISSEYSLRVAEIFERDDLGDKVFLEMFPSETTIQEKIRDFLDQMLNNPFMSEKLFARANPLANYSYTMVNSARKEVTKVLDFNFSRIHGTDENGKRTNDIEKIMVVIDDRTEEFELKRELEQKAQEQASKVEKLYQILQLPPNVFSGFISESSVTLDIVYQNLNKLVVGETSRENIQLLQVCYREVHTLKGNARALNLDSIGKTAHELEDVFDELKENPTELTAELKDKVFQAVASLKNDIQDGNSLFEKILNMQSALQSKSQDAMSEFEERFRGIVQKESDELGKHVSFDFRNQLERPLEGTTMLKLRNPLSHIVRNSMSHGIESDEEREKMGKPLPGRISISLQEKEGFLFVTCEDDGSGLKTEKIRNKAVEQNLITAEQASSMSETEIHKLIFSSGLSTAEEVSDISGRGIGMDAVREDLKALNSVIMVASKPAQYTRFTIKIPITPAG